MSYLAYMAQRGYSLTRTLKKEIVWAIAVWSSNEGQFGKDGPSEHWWTGFRACHPECGICCGGLLLPPMIIYSKCFLGPDSIVLKARMMLSMLKVNQGG